MCISIWLKKMFFPATIYSIDDDTTKDEVLMEREKKRYDQYLRKFDRNGMVGFMMSHLKMRRDLLDENTLDRLSEIHKSLIEMENGRICYHLVRSGTGLKFCDQMGRLHCGAIHENGSILRRENISPCKQINMGNDTGHSINYYATCVGHAFLTFFEWDHK